jgi:hypothetical protein
VHSKMEQPVVMSEVFMVLKIIHFIIFKLRVQFIIIIIIIINICK